MSLLLFYGGSANPSLRGGYKSSLSSTLNYMPVYAMRYNMARDEFLENMGQVKRLRIRWALPGGVQRFEFTIKAKSRQDAYDRYKRNLTTENNGHHADGIAILDSYLDIPLADGWVYEVRLDGLFVTYVCASTWERCKEQYQTSDPSATTIDTSEYLTDTLAAVVPASGTDTSNVQSTGVQIGTYTVDASTGDSPQDIIKTIIKMGTSTSGQLLDFYFKPNFMNGIYPQLPVPVLKARVANVTGWNISRNDMSQLQIGSHIWRLKNDAKVFYSGGGSVTGTDAASQSAYWEHQWVDTQSDLNVTQATNWKDTNLEYDSQPQQQVAFTIDAPIIRATAGGRWHISRMMTFAESIIIRDLFPTAEQIDEANNGNVGFRPVALDYDHERQKIRVTPDNKDGDQRLDVILQGLGAEVGQTIGV